MRATIKDVAKRAGVSPATVSLVLNKRTVSISSETRQAVEEAAESLDYRPNQLAVSLVKKKTNLIGLLIPDNNNYFHAAYSTQVEQAVNRCGYNLILGITNESADKVIHYVNDFTDYGVAGIILAQSVFDNEEDNKRCAELIGKIRVPLILTDRVMEGRGLSLNMVVHDDEKGGYLAAKHLLDLGHTRIGIVSGQRYLKNTIDRITGIMKAYKESNAEFDPDLIYEGNYQLFSGQDALPYLLGQGVTAIFAFNDMMAAGVYKQCRNYHIRIPEDLSVVGYDDILVSDLVDPPLTTVEYPYEQMAQAVVNRLVGLMEDENGSSAPTRDLFSPKLKVKGSTRARIIQ